jgi:uncharacterized protein (TIGR02001 family)
VRPSPLRLCAAALAVFFPCAVVPTATAGERVGGSVGVTSDYRLQGLSLSDGEPAAQAELHYSGRLGDGAAWYGGLWASKVKLTDETDSSVQLEAFLGARWALGPDWQGKLTIAHYAHPWDSLLKHYDYDELTLEAGFRDTFKLTAAYSPNTDLYAGWYGLVEDRKSLAFEASAGMPLRGSFAVSAGVGYRDITSFFDKGYWYGSAGLAYDRAGLHASLFRVQTDRTARRLFSGDSASPGWVGTLLWTF